MKLTVFGATGRIGEHMVRQALDAGHRVSAVVRGSSRLDISHPALEIHRVPGLADPEPMWPALVGSDAALSGVGPRSRKDVTVASTATRGILAALKSAGVPHFVAVSAAPVGPIPDGEGFLNRYLLMPFIKTLLKDIYADVALMEREIMASGLEWTIVRPPRLTDKPLTGDYRVALAGNVPNGRTIGRADVAHLMLASLTDTTMANRAIGVAK
jgi:uncharacterized protein YbjT (DUF2867 family)